MFSIDWGLVPTVVAGFLIAELLGTVFGVLAATCGYAATRLWAVCTRR